eukprot:gene20176-20730_t
MVDVAKAAGCSQATVSLVLNNAPGVKLSAELRQRVVEAARALGYGQSSIVRRPALAGLQGGCVGFIVDQLATTQEAINAIEGARQDTWDDDVTILVAQTQGRTDAEERVVDRLLRAGADGIVFMSIFTRKVALSRLFYDLPVPMVLVNCYTTDNLFPAVVPDEVAGGIRATTALIERGHRRIGMITGEPFMEGMQDRLKGYRRALKQAHIEFDRDLVVEGNWTPSSGYDGAQKLLALRDRPTAIFCQNDRMAVGCYDALRDAGLSIPDDVAVVGYDDDEICRHMRPQLSTLVLPHRAMGAWAVRQLAAMMPGTTQSHPMTKLECPFIDRQSIGEAGA